MSENNQFSQAQENSFIFIQKIHSTNPKIT